VRKRVKEWVAGPAQCQRKAEPKESADGDDEMKGCAAQRQVLHDNQQPDSGIGQME
jgi:hypothetical protein